MVSFLFSYLIVIFSFNIRAARRVAEYCFSILQGIKTFCPEERRFVFVFSQSVKLTVRPHPFAELSCASREYHSIDDFLLCHHLSRRAALQGGGGGGGAEGGLK